MTILLPALVPACAQPCFDDGLRQRCDVVALATSSGSTGAALDTSGGVAHTDGTDASSSSGADPVGDSSGVALSEGSSEGDGGSSSDGGASDSSSGGEGARAEPVDLSGWIVVQAASDREFVLPEGTLVPRGGTLVLARDVGRDDFEAFWGVTLGADVVYLDSADVLPVCNGDETFALADGDGVPVDEPSPPLTAGTVLTRIDAASPGDDADAWALGDPELDATPGVADPTGASPGEVRVSEIVDPEGVGAFVYEYVELHVGA
ncbi:MAG: lamin tail domain-containing protein [Nannocystaceae bacterium]|nr:lamin tail domain-containing protein [Nannocystaceae bacterium]